MTPIEAIGRMMAANLQHPDRHAQISIVRDGQTITGTLVGMRVTNSGRSEVFRPDDPVATYVPGPSTIVLWLAPWMIEVELTPQDNVTVTD